MTEFLDRDPAIEPQVQNTTDGIQLYCQEPFYLTLKTAPATVIDLYRTIISRSSSFRQMTGTEKSFEREELVKDGKMPTGFKNLEALRAFPCMGFTQSYSQRGSRVIGWQSSII